MHLRTTATLGVTATLAVFALFSTARAEEKQAIVTWSTFVRAGPGSNFGSIDEIDGGVSVTLLQCAKDWCAIRSGGRVGYVMADALNLPALPRRGATPAGSPSSCVEADAVGWSGPVPQRFCSTHP